MRACCPDPGTGEHKVACPHYEPPLTQEEIRQLRHLLAKTNGHKG